MTLNKIHELLIQPGSKVKIYCKDGLSSTTVLAIDHIFNFGGKVKFINCGAANIYAELLQAEGSMHQSFSDKMQEHNKELIAG